VLNGDVVAEEPRRACAGVGDQRLVLGQFQLEFITQERRQPLFDLLGLGLGSGEPEEVVIGVPTVSEPSVVRIMSIRAGHAAHPLTQLPRLGAVAASASTRQRRRHLQVGRVAGPAFPSVVLRNQNRLDKGVQPVQVDVGQDRGGYAANTVGNFCFDVMLSYRRLERPRRISGGS